MLPLLLLLLLLFTAAAGDVPSRNPLPRVAGAAIYHDSCWQCHGERGLGDGPLAARIPSPQLAGRVSRPDFDALVPLILHGKNDMPGFSPSMGVYDARRVLLWLEGLDPVTGLDPTIRTTEEDEEDEDDEDDAEEEGGDEQ